MTTADVVLLLVLDGNGPGQADFFCAGNPIFLQDLNMFLQCEFPTIAAKRQRNPSEGSHSLNHLRSGTWCGWSGGRCLEKPSENHRKITERFSREKNHWARNGSKRMDSAAKAVLCCTSVASVSTFVPNHATNATSATSATRGHRHCAFVLWETPKSARRMGVSLALCSFLGEALGPGGCKKGTLVSAQNQTHFRASVFALWSLYNFIVFWFPTVIWKMVYHHIYHHISSYISSYYLVGSFNRSIFQLWPLRPRQAAELKARSRVSGPDGTLHANGLGGSWPMGPAGPLLDSTAQMAIEGRSSILGISH